MRNGVIWGVLAFGVVATVAFLMWSRSEGERWSESWVPGGVVFYALTVLPVVFVFGVLSLCVLAEVVMARIRRRERQGVFQLSDLRPPAEPDDNTQTEGQRALLTFGVLMGAFALSVGMASKRPLLGIAAGVGLFVLAGALPSRLLARITAARRARALRAF